METGRFGPLGWFRPYQSNVDYKDVPFSWIEEEAIWAFLHDHIQHPNFRKATKYLVNIYTLGIWERFRVERKSCRTAEQLQDHFVYVMAEKLETAPLPGEAKIELYFGLDIPLPRRLFEKLLRAGCHVTLDQRKCVQYFSHEGDGLELRQMNHNLPNRLGIEQEQFIWDWLLKIIEDKNTGQIVRGQAFRNQEHDWSKFVRDTNFPISAKRCMANFHLYMIPTLHEAPLDMMSKLKLLFALELKVPKEIFESLLSTDIIALDGKGCLKTYSDKFGMRLNANDVITYGETRLENKGIPFTEQEDINMLRYMLSFTKDPEHKTVKPIRQLFDSPNGWLQHVNSEFNSRNRNAQTYHKRFHNILIRNLDSINIDPAIKLALHCTLRVPASPRYLRDLRKKLFVKVDHQGRIERVHDPKLDVKMSDKNIPHSHIMCAAKFETF